jgi:hypothetical protein
MISMNCKSCGEANQVESFLTAAQQNCSSCGRPLMGESLAKPTSTRRGEPKPWERLEEAPAQVGAGTRNISIKAIASVNFLYGSLYVACGAFIWLGSGFVTQRSLSQSGQSNVNVDEFKTMMTIIAGIVIMLGMPMIVAGAGLLQRAAWSRYLALVLAGLSALLCVWAVVGPMMLHRRPDVCSIILYATYSGITFFVLLQPEVAAEFGSRPSEPS